MSGIGTDSGASASTLTISIVNHGNRDATMSLVNRLAMAPERLSAEIVVLDNASEDGSVEALANIHPGITLIAQEHRAGFGANHNRVIQQTHSKYVLLLNDDVIADVDDVAALVTYMEEHPRVGAAGPRVVSPAGRLLQTAWAELRPRTAMLFALSAGQVGWVQSKGPRPRAVGRASGCALILRRSMLPSPVFDESFFMYAEDSDLCSRLRAAGGEIHYVPSVRITHLGRASTAAVPGPRRVEQARSTRHYLRKHHGPLAASLTRIALALGYLEKALLQSLLSRLLRRRVSGAASAEFRQAASDVLRMPRGDGLRELADAYNRRHQTMPSPGAEPPAGHMVAADARSVAAADREQ